MQWFRLYTEIMDDPKILEMTDAQFRGWIHLLCLAGRSTERGLVENRPRFLAKSMRISVKKLENMLDFLEHTLEIITIENEKIVINAWEKRNPKSDNGAERMKTYREKQAVTVTSHETIQNGNSDVANRTDKNREDKKEDHGDSPSGDPPSAPKKNPEKKTDPRVTKAIDFFAERYAEKKEIAADINWARDGSLIKQILASLDKHAENTGESAAKVFADLVTLYLESDDYLAEKSAWSLPIMRKNFNALMLKRNGHNTGGNGKKDPYSWENSRAYLPVPEA